MSPDHEAGSVATSSALRYDPFEVGALADPYPVYERLREEAPLYHHAEGDFWVLSRFDDVFRATRDFTHYSSAKGLTFIKDEMKILGLAPTFIMMDPPKHTALRRLIAKGFTPERVSAMEPLIRAFVRERAEHVAERCAAGETPDIVREYTSPIPTFALAELLGVPPEDRARFDPWSTAITSSSMEEESLGAAVQAVAGLFGYFIQLLERRRVDPGSDMLSALRSAEVDGQTLSNWDLLGFCFVFIAGGNDTTNHMLSNALVRLQQHPDQRAYLVAHPEAIGPAVDEFLRFDAPVQGLSRTLTAPMELYGQTLPEDAKVHLLYASANRDPRQYGERAHQLDVTRQVQRHMSFTQGPHFCIGAHLARMMGRIGLEELLARFPDYQLDLDAAVRTRSAFVRGYERLPFSVTLGQLGRT